MDMQAKARREKLYRGLGDTTGLSWTINYIDLVAKQEFIVDMQEKKILQELAKKVAELAAQPQQCQKIKRWKDHHALKETTPLIFCDPESAWYELIPAEELHCTGNLARIWEFKLRKEIYWATRIRDDRAVLPTFSVHYIWSKTPRGLETKIIGGICPPKIVPI